MKATTDWFPSDVKPVRAGWYECKTIYGAFNGKKWWWSGAAWRYSPTQPTLVHQDRVWRGLTHPPA